ncbi:MAG: paraquat-inducible protein A, partial [Planctomycetota bacterium]
VVFPLSKLVILRAGIADTIAGRPASGAQRITNVLSKYSMVDVFVIALLIVASKSYPGGTTVDVHWGAFAFAAAALASIPVAAGLSARQA